MLTDEEIISIRNKARLNAIRQVDLVAFARQIELAVIDKLRAQAVDEGENELGEPDVIYLHLHDTDDGKVTKKADFRADGATWCRVRLREHDVRYVRADLLTKKCV